MDKRLIEAVELFEDVMVFGTERVLKNVDSPVWREYSQEQLHTMKLLKKNGPQSAGRLAELQGVHKSAISNRLKKLEEKALIEQVPVKGDQRTKIVQLTAAGAEVVQQSNEAVYSFIESIFAEQVEDAEVEQFLTMFRKIRSILKLEGEVDESNN